MDDPRRWMWSEACAFLERAERLRGRFFEPGPSGQGIAAWEPPVDIFETEREFLVMAALPGVAADDLEVHLDGNALIVAGRRRLSAALRGAVIHRMEVPHGRFERRVWLSGARVQVGATDFSNGLLTIALKKAS